MDILVKRNLPVDMDDPTAFLFFASRSCGSARSFKSDTQAQADTTPRVDHGKATALGSCKDGARQMVGQPFHSQLHVAFLGEKPLRSEAVPDIKNWISENTEGITAPTRVDWASPKRRL